MELLVVGVNKDVTHVDNELSFCYEITEDVVYQHLKGGRGVAVENHDFYLQIFYF